MDKEGERFRGVTWVRVSFWASRRLGARLGAARQFYSWPRSASPRREAHWRVLIFCVRTPRRRGGRFVSCRPFFCIKIAEPRAWLQRLLLVHYGAVKRLDAAVYDRGAPPPYQKLPFWGPRRARSAPGRRSRQQRMLAQRLAGPL